MKSKKLKSMTFLSISEKMVKKQLFLSIATLFIFLFMFLGISLVSAVSCSNTFISKSMYNICYTPNVTAQSSLSIWDKDNNTLITYQRETHTDPTNTINRDYAVNFSDPKIYNGTTYLTFFGNASDGNQTSRGIIYFMDDYIWMSYQKDLFANFTGSERTNLNTFLVSSYQEMNTGTITANPGTGTGIMLSGKQTIKHITHSPALVNFTTSGQYSRAILNLSYSKTYFNSYGIPIGVDVGINTSDIFTNNQGSVNLIRQGNQTQLAIGTAVNNNPLAFVRGHAGFIIAFNESLFVLGSDISNNTANTFYEGLTGLQYYATNCATSYGSFQHSCTPWRARTMIMNNYLEKVFNDGIFNKLGLLKNIQLSLFYLNTNNINQTFLQDYQFNPVSGTNELNNTHTRLISDYLVYLVQMKEKDQSVNQTISTIINHLQSSSVVFNENVTGDKIIPHSTGTKSSADRDFTVNTHTIGTNALLIAHLSGYSVNTTLMEMLINSSIDAYPRLFNESRGNSSYNAITGDSIYFTSPRYGNAVYISIELEDYLNFYIHTKNETSHLIFQRKINELNGYFNGSMYDCPANTCGDYDVSGDAYQKMRANYHKLNITAFSINTWSKNKVISAQPYYAWDLIPNGREFYTIYHPIYIGKNNETYFLDKENGFNFQTPNYAMVNDFYYDSSKKGIKINLKWAYNTTGNFTNLTNNGHQYMYDPQGERRITFGQQLNFTATDSVLKYWYGNISNSVRIDVYPLESNFTIDNENFGRNFLNYSNGKLVNDINDSINISIKSATNAIVFLDNGTVIVNTTLTSNDGNLLNNYSLGSNRNVTYLDSINLTENSARVNSPFWISSRTDNGEAVTYHLASNLTDTVNGLDFYPTNTIKCGSATYASDLGVTTSSPTVSCINGFVEKVVINNYDPATNSNVLVLTYGIGGDAGGGGSNVGGESGSNSSTGSFYNRTFLCGEAEKFIKFYTKDDVFNYTTAEYNAFKNKIVLLQGFGIEDSVLKPFVNDFAGQCPDFIEEDGTPTNTGGQTEEEFNYLYLWIGLFVFVVLIVIILIVMGGNAHKDRTVLMAGLFQKNKYDPSNP